MTREGGIEEVGISLKEMGKAYDYSHIKVIVNDVISEYCLQKLLSGQKSI